MMFLMLFWVFGPFGFLLQSLLLSSIVKRGFLVSVLDENFLIFLKIDHNLLFNLEVVVLLPLDVLRTQLGQVPPLQVTAPGKVVVNLERLLLGIDSE